MSKKVHILNGDSTSFGIKEGGIAGETIIWREMLVEGPLDKNIGSDTFWAKRYSFFKNELGVSKLEYYDKTIKELVKIENLTDCDEIVMWFEYDLFCQVNLIALCSYLLKYFRKDINYYLVCTGKEKGKVDMQSLSDYHPNAYNNLLEHKIKISRHDLIFADQSWKKYVSNDLQEFDFNKNRKFNYLQAAIYQHLKRFSNNSGLNQIDSKIIEIINSNDFTAKEIVRELLIWQKKETVYGFGDIQYVRYLKKLKDFYTIVDGIYYLNDRK